MNPTAKARRRDGRPRPHARARRSAAAAARRESDRAARRYRRLRGRSAGPDGADVLHRELSALVVTLRYCVQAGIFEHASTMVAPPGRGHLFDVARAIRAFCIRLAELDAGCCCRWSCTRPVAAAEAGAADLRARAVGLLVATDVDAVLSRSFPRPAAGVAVDASCSSRPRPASCTRVVAAREPCRASTSLPRRRRRRRPSRRRAAVTDGAASVPLVPLVPPLARAAGAAARHAAGAPLVPCRLRRRLGARCRRSSPRRVPQPPSTPATPHTQPTHRYNHRAKQVGSCDDLRDSIVARACHGRKQPHAI